MINRTPLSASPLHRRLLAALRRARSARRFGSAMARALLHYGELPDPFERAERRLDREHPGWRARRSSPSRPGQADSRPPEPPASP